MMGTGSSGVWGCKISNTYRTVSVPSLLYLHIEFQNTGPCQFLFNESLLDGGLSYVDLIGEKRILLRFGLSYQNGLLHDRLATVDPGRIRPHAGSPDPLFHKVCITFTDHKS